MHFKLLSILLVFTFILRCWGQVPLSEIDININFQERFYEKEILLTKNSFVYTDSIYVYSEENLLELGKSPNDFEKRKHGKWIEFFDKNWQHLESSNDYSYYSLTEYEVGITSGNSFFFDKNGKLHHMTMRYPPYKDEVFHGFRIIWFNPKEKVKSIQYERFTSAIDTEYLNRTTYFANGKIETYTLRDAENSNYHIIEYNKKGKITYELVANNEEQYKSKRKCFGRVEMRESREQGISYKSKLVKGELKWKKEI